MSKLDFTAFFAVCHAFSSGGLVILGLVRDEVWMIVMGAIIGLVALAGAFVAGSMTGETK